MRPICPRSLLHVQPPGTQQERNLVMRVSHGPWLQLLPNAKRTPPTTSCTTRRPTMSEESVNVEPGEPQGDGRFLDTHQLLSPLCQAGGGCGGGLHTRAADEERGWASNTLWHHGCARSSVGCVPLHGPRPAEVPPHHQEAALPHHGEHPETPGFLPHQ